MSEENNNLRAFEDIESTVSEGDAEAVEAVDKEAVADESPQKNKLPRIARRLTVGSFLALIPTILILIAIAVSVHMNRLTFYEETPLRHDIMLISMGIVLVSALLAAFRPRIPKAIGWIVWALAPAGTMFLSEWIFHDPFNTMTYQVVLLNLAIYYITAALLLFVTRNTFVSVVASSVFPLVLAIANHYVKLFRGTMLFPWDLQSIGVAMTVADNYKYDFPVVLAFVVICFIAIWQLSYFSRVKILRKSVPKLIISAVCAVLSLGLFIGYAAYMRTDDAAKRFKLYPYLFTPNAVYDNNGAMASIFYSLQFMAVEKPDSYSTERVNELIAEYEAVESDANGSSNVKPNIIAIMNEAWSDITAVAPFTTNIDVFPFTSTLKEDTVRGKMYVSIVGGNTANSEFEFLTSSSMAFLPPGCVAYQQFIKSETPTLVASLEAQGYQTIGFHPYYAKGWDRNKVYPFFGFDNSYFLEDMPADIGKLRLYVSDRAMFDQIEQMYENREQGRPFFLFGVTMQNHGGYTTAYENLEQDVVINGLEYNSALSMYLSLIRQTDFAFESLVSYFSNVDEPTVILMFGDHQPGTHLTAPLYSNAGLPYDPDSASHGWSEYIVPFIMWANYDIDERDDIVTSPNYLSTLLCEVTGLEMTPYQKFLVSLREKYPVITANFFIDAEGEIHTANEIAAVDLLEEYRILQYNQIIDRKHCVESAFTVAP